MMKQGRNGLKSTDKSRKNAGLGRGLGSLGQDNKPEEKKPLVVRRGEYVPKHTKERATPSLSNAAGVGGKLVIHTDKLPERAERPVRSTRKNTTVIVRTERPETQKRYTSEESLSSHDRFYVRKGEPIVINPRKKSGK